MLQKIILAIVTNNRVKDVDPKLLSLWESILSKFDIRLVEEGVKAYLISEESKYDNGRMPQIGLIVAFMKKIAFGDESEKIALANEAWATVYKNVCAQRYHIEDLVAERTIATMGGWYKAFRMMNTDDEPFKRRDFIELYLTYLQKQEVLESFSMEQIEHDTVKAIQQS